MVNEKLDMVEMGQASPLPNIPKFTLRDWVKHPTTILLVIVTGAAWIILFVYVNSQLTQVEYLKNRVSKLELQIDKYTNTILFKEATEKSLKDTILIQKTKIDSLKGGIQ